MVAIYPRQSIDKKDSMSIEQQVNACISMCDNKGWEYKIYDKDKGYSGKTLNRPSFEELMNDVKAGRIDRILCYKFDRISRNISDFCGLLEELQKYHCEFVSISENFDTTSPIGRAMVYICMVFAQMERESISQRVHDNYYYRTELGFWGGGTAPYGYKLSRIKHKGKTHTVLEPDQNTAHVVQDIYKMYLEPSGSANTILHRLNNELHIPSKQGGLWTSRVLMDILSRPIYAPNDMHMYHYLESIGAKISNPPEEFDGNASIDLYGKKGEASKHKRCRDASDMYCNISSHDSIVDSDTWIRVQRKRNEMVRKPSRAGTGKNSYFTGLMKCECCGTGVSYTNSRGTMGYYICSSRKNRGWNSCDMKPAAKKTTDPAILDYVVNYYRHPETLLKIKLATPHGDITPFDFKRKNALLGELEGIETSIQNLMESIMAGNDTLKRYANEKILELDKQKRSVRDEIELINQKYESNTIEMETIQRIRDIIDDIPDTLAGDDFDKIRDLCKLLINKIVFLKDGRINVECTI